MSKRSKPKVQNKDKNKKKSSQKSVKSRSRVQRLYPSNVLEPVGEFLNERLRYLQRRRSALKKEDPFSDTARLTDNASPDSDAAEQFGHARNSAIRKQLDKGIIQTRKALARIKLGTYGICEDCGKMIDTDRLMVYPEATYCADCQAKREK